MSNFSGSCFSLWSLGNFQAFYRQMNNIYQYVHDNNNQYQPILSLSDFFSASLLVFISKTVFYGSLCLNNAELQALLLNLVRHLAADWLIRVSLRICRFSHHPIILLKSVQSGPPHQKRRLVVVCDLECFHFLHVGSDS